MYTLRDKTCFCIAEFGDQFKIGTSYLDIINNAFKEIVNINKDKYELADVTEGFILPNDENWENNTGEIKSFTGYMEPGIKGILTGWLKKNNISIKEFLENPRYVIFIDSRFVDILGTLDYHNLISDNVTEIYEV